MPTGVIDGAPNGGAAEAGPFGEFDDVRGVLEFLRKRQVESPGFFYAMQVDGGNRLSAVFWADARARAAYGSFADAVVLDTTYRKTRYMPPLAAFRGVNHHLQGVTLGCCLLMDENKTSLLWLLDTWLAAMGRRRHPGLLVTDQGQAMEAAVARVMPGTRHRFCQRHVLSRCKQKMSDLYAKHAGLKADLKGCVCSADTIEEFEARWEFVLESYNLRENAWLQSLYDSRQQWAWVYQKGFFFPELLKSQRSESLNKFFKAHFNAKTPLLAFISRYEQEMVLCAEKEAEADFATLYLMPNLKTPSVMERQAANVYTRALFDIFQEEFIESLGYHADKVQDGAVLKFIVSREEDNGRSYMVTFNQSDQQAKCTCCKFEYAAVLCRHVLRIFFMVGVRCLSEEYIAKRWTMDAVSSIGVNERPLEPRVNSPDCLATWYNDLCRDGLAYGLRAAMFPDVYNDAKVALQKAFAEVVSAKNQEMSALKDHSEHQDIVLLRMPLPTFQPKKAPSRK